MGENNSGMSTDTEYVLYKNYLTKYITVEMS